MHIMENRICGIDDSHRKFSFRISHRHSYESHTAGITVTIHPHGVPNDGDAGSLILSVQLTNDELAMQGGVRVLIVDGNYHYEASIELRNNNLG